MRSEEERRMEHSHVQGSNVPLLVHQTIVWVYTVEVVRIPRGAEPAVLADTRQDISGNRERRV
jgi:hypothetical protein